MCAPCDPILQARYDERRVPMSCRRPGESARADSEKKSLPSRGPNEVNKAVIALSINFYQLGKSKDRALDFSYRAKRSAEQKFLGNRRALRSLCAQAITQRETVKLIPRRAARCIRLW